MTNVNLVELMSSTETAPKLVKPEFATDGVYQLILKLTSFKPEDRPSIADVITELEREEEKAQPQINKSDTYMVSPLDSKQSLSVKEKEYQNSPSTTHGSQEKGDYTISPPGANSTSISDEKK